MDKQRETTSGAFFLSPEFQYTGSYIYCVYKGSLGRMPTFLEFMRDVPQLVARHHRRRCGFRPSHRSRIAPST